MQFCVNCSAQPGYLHAKNCPEVRYVGKPNPHYCARHNLMFDDVCGKCEDIEEARADQLADHQGMTGQ